MSFGLILIGVGTLLLLDRLGLIYFAGAARMFWPIILIAVGLGKLLYRPVLQRLREENDNGR